MCSSLVHFAGEVRAISPVTYIQFKHYFQDAAIANEDQHIEDIEEDVQHVETDAEAGGSSTDKPEETPKVYRKAIEIKEKPMFYECRETIHVNSCLLEIIIVF